MLSEGEGDARLVAAQAGFALMVMRFAVLGFSHDLRGAAFSRVCLSSALAPIGAALSAESAGVSDSLGLVACQPVRALR